MRTLTAVVLAMMMTAAFAEHHKGDGKGRKQATVQQSSKPQQAQAARQTCRPAQRHDQPRRDGDRHDGRRNDHRGSFWIDLGRALTTPCRTPYYYPYQYGYVPAPVYAPAPTVGYAVTVTIAKNECGRLTLVTVDHSMIRAYQNQRYLLLGATFPGAEVAGRVAEVYVDFVNGYLAEARVTQSFSNYAPGDQLTMVPAAN